MLQRSGGQRGCGGKAVGGGRAQLCAAHADRQSEADTREEEPGNEIDVKISKAKPNIIMTVYVHSSH